MITTRPLVRADLRVVEALLAKSSDEGFRFGVRLLEMLASAPLALDDAREFFLGVFDDERIVAVGGVTPDPYADSVDVGRVRHVYVAATARRQGIGRRLMGSLQQRACAEFAVLRLRTDTAAAAAFYESLGYQPTTEPHATHRRECATISVSSARS